MNQLFTVLWAEVGKWIQGTILEDYFEHTKTKVQLKGQEMTWFAIAKTASTKEGMAGSHAENMLIICDEASGIDDEILETLEGTITDKDNKLVYISNPTRTNGAFFDCFNANRKMWKCLTVNAEDCERVNKENIESILNKFGSREHPVYLVRVRGEFPEGNENSIIPRALAISRIGIKANYKLEDTLIYGLDISRAGSDFTECYKDDNGTPKEIFRYSHKDLMQTVGAIANECQATADKRHIVVIDGVGVGGGVVDRLNELIEEDYANKDTKDYEMLVPNLEIIEINNGSSIVFDPKNFGNVIAEMFFQAKEGLENNTIGLEDDTELIEDLTIREIAFKSDGKIIVEKKDSFKKKAGRSPDKGDAWLYCVYARNFI